MVQCVSTIKGHLSFSVPCESGNYWKCDVSSCVACPQGFYQPQWGQTSCWPCPFNTTTDTEGASSPTECKREYYKLSSNIVTFKGIMDSTKPTSFWRKIMNGIRFAKKSQKRPPYCHKNTLQIF